VNVDIIIPTCRPAAAIQALIREIAGTRLTGGQIILTCFDASAAVNRNIGLERAGTEIVIMVDDDVERFPRGWDEVLARVRAERPSVVMASARLLRPDGADGQMLGNPERRSSGLVVVPRRELPTACVAIRNDGTQFSERFAGSGWEDTDFCARLRGLHPAGEFVVVCDVAVVHRNEMKAQAAPFERNRSAYVGVWGAHRFC